MTNIESIQGIFTASNNPEIIVKDLTLQVTQKAGKLLVEDVNKEYFFLLM